VTVENDVEWVSSIVLASPLLRSVLKRWDAIALPDCWLVAGAVAQTVWNHSFGLEPAHGISDIDIVYFDPDDLSQASEERHAARLREALSDLPAWIDVKNEARVHLWYEAKFGYPIRPYASIVDAIATFPTTATAIGIRPNSDKLSLHAPYGFTDLLGSIVRPNKKQITRQIYETKLARWRALWPKLVVIDW
jgi:hypothetical protein